MGIKHSLHEEKFKGNRNVGKTSLCLGENNWEGSKTLWREEKGEGEV